jgi:hypothetical protein
MPNRSEVKDALAKAIIYGGPTVVIWSAIAAAVAAHVISPTVGKNLHRQVSRMMPRAASIKKRAWDRYCNTGSISEAIEELFQ